MAENHPKKEDKDNSYDSKHDGEWHEKDTTGYVADSKDDGEWHHKEKATEYPTFFPTYVDVSWSAGGSSGKSGKGSGKSGKSRRYLRRL
jgi:hypothetical protein